MAGIEDIYDNLLESLRGEFVDEAEDNLNSVDIFLENVRSGADKGEKAIDQLMRVAHSLKGSSSVADFPLVTFVMHRLEDYLTDIEELSPGHMDDIQVYLDKAREFSAVEFDQTSVATAELSRELPHRRGFDDDDVVLDGASRADIIETLVVIKEKSTGKLFERELRAAGLAVTMVKSSYDGLEMTVKARPDLVVVSGVLDDLTGVDLCAAISAMPTTKRIPVCILTSFQAGHAELEGLPKRAFIVNKNNLKDDLHVMLRDLNLI